jgi:predicted RNase H-like HicB family nuclease
MCPALPGLVTEGDTMKEARRMADDALRVYLESLVGDGLLATFQQEKLIV